jgi:hypothetical protein
LLQVRKTFKYLLIVVLVFISNITITTAQLKPEKIFSVFYTQLDGSFSIKILKPNPDIDKIVIMNLIGRKMKEQLYVAGQDIIKFTDLSDFPNGIYIVLIKDKNEKILESAKLVLSK